MLLTPHAGTIAWTIITFFVVFLILRAKVWGPLLAALDEREKSIRESLETADRARAEAEAQLAEHEKRLNEAETEARKIVGEAREAAEKVRSQIVDDAKAEAQRAIDQGRETLEVEKNAALDQLRAEVADLAVGAAGAILDAELDAERNRKIADDFISRLPDSQGN